MKKYAPEKEFEISTRAQAVLCSHVWRGNVRELENAIERAVLLSKDTTIDLNDLPEEITQSTITDDMKTLEQLEKEYIQYVLQNAIDLQEAAKILGINPSTLWRKRKHYNL
jgi:NtrC-family two-component system response regulator AlgB